MWMPNQYDSAPAWARLDGRGEHDESLAGLCDDLPLDDGYDGYDDDVVNRALDHAYANPTAPVITMLREITHGGRA